MTTYEALIRRLKKLGATYCKECVAHVLECRHRVKLCDRGNPYTCPMEPHAHDEADLERALLSDPAARRWEEERK